MRLTVERALTRPDWFAVSPDSTLYKFERFSSGMAEVYSNLVFAIALFTGYMPGPAAHTTNVVILYFLPTDSAMSLKSWP